MASFDRILFPAPTPSYDNKNVHLLWIPKGNIPNPEAPQDLESYCIPCWLQHY